MGKWSQKNIPFYEEIINYFGENNIKTEKLMLYYKGERKFGDFSAIHLTIDNKSVVLYDFYKRNGLIILADGFTEIKEYEIDFGASDERNNLQSKKANHNSSDCLSAFLHSNDIVIIIDCYGIEFVHKLCDYICKFCRSRTISKNIREDFTENSNSINDFLSNMLDESLTLGSGL